MTKTDGKIIPIIDLFAGPGGLGEGFSAFQTPDGRQPFRIAMSIEKDPRAHATLTLRSFVRQFAPGKAPQEYYEYLRHADRPEVERRKRLFDMWPDHAERAEKAALLAELGVEGRRQFASTSGLLSRDTMNSSYLAAHPVKPIP